MIKFIIKLPYYIIAILIETLSFIIFLANIPITMLLLLFMNLQDITEKCIERLNTNINKYN